MFLLKFFIWKKSSGVVSGFHSDMQLLWSWSIFKSQPRLLGKLVEVITVPDRPLYHTGKALKAVGRISTFENLNIRE